MTFDQRHKLVEDACAALVIAEQSITFNEVAQRTGISRATLYRNPDLRALIEEHRLQGHQANTITGLNDQIEHLRIALNAIAEKVRNQEEELRRLRN